VDGHLREHHHPSRADVARHARHRRGGVALVHEHEPPDHRVERAAGELDFAKVPGHELDVLVPRLDRPPTRGRERLLVALDSDHRPIAAHQLGYEKADVARPAADVEHPHPGLDPRALQQTARERRIPIRLATQPLVLVLAGCAQRILRVSCGRHFATVYVTNAYATWARRRSTPSNCRGRRRRRSGRSTGPVERPTRRSTKASRVML
jgi:hypothetical protein